jgi:hypothetical protein
MDAKAAFNDFYNDTVDADGELLATEHAAALAATRSQSR